ncbi:molybdopterin converting factor subunit 1 [Planctomicrobium sp.]|jgi:sulfur-carrier protein|nr:molybdopterin converting factor subunit 1 [Planctomicrobium sp.]MDB4733732.1 molybdopterin converting factor subunit 1 [Planctomicrobium sp.]
MLLNVKLFARASELAGASEVQLKLPANSTVAEFRKALVVQHSALAPVISSLFVAIDAEYANDDQTISESAEIACFPPVSGG